VTIAIGMVTLLSSTLGGREMSSESTSWTTRTCTARPMAYIYRLFKGVVLGLEVQCLKVLGLRLWDHTVVMPDMVQVMINMALDLAAMAFSPITLVDHVSPTWWSLSSNGTWYVWCFF
jgi:hypothetical protein